MQKLQIKSTITCVDIRPYTCDQPTTSLHSPIHLHTVQSSVASLLIVCGLYCIACDHENKPSVNIETIVVGI